MRALAVTGDKRSSLLPNVPTASEQGVAGFSYVNWTGFSFPSATPPIYVNRISAELAKVAKAPDVIASLDAQGGATVGSTPQQFRQLIVNEIARWNKVVQETGITMD